MLLKKHSIRTPLFLFLMLLLLNTLIVAENSGYTQSRSHSIIHKGPAVDFFSGAILGNGGLGAIVTTRPDAIVVYFGHNNVWDIRVAENHRQELGTFQEIFARVKAIPDTLQNLTENDWYNNYIALARDNYGQPYPRPFPCGSLLLGFDRRKIEVLGHRLDIHNGLCTIEMLIDGQPAFLELFVAMEKDEFLFQLLDANKALRSNCFERIRLIPDPSTPREFPAKSFSTTGLGFTQILPFRFSETVQSDPRDRAFQLQVQVTPRLFSQTRLDWEGNPKTMEPGEQAMELSTKFLGRVTLREGLADSILHRTTASDAISKDAYHEAAVQTERAWLSFWSKSAIRLQDAELEKIWYRNLYFLNCAVKAGVTCPGLFANWSYNQIGTAWHGDYHMNYNTQQPFWATFSSNHMDKNLPYVDLVHKLLPVSRRWAKEYYGLSGAYFPHTGYPVEMTMNPYPVPTWGWEICETPWTVQGLWWHYLYSMDAQQLRHSLFSPIRDAVLFLVDYLSRPEAHGPQWRDDRYHIFPTVPPELYGLKPGFKYNYDCLVDLTLTKFVFKAYLQAVEILQMEKAESATVNRVRDILQHYPDYPTAATPKGPVFVSVPGEHSEVVYNVPNSLMTVFPGEEHGLFSPPETQAMLKNTYENMQIEGGNDLVFLNLQAARLGLLDLERFKRQVAYCELPNGACSDMVLQVHGRYSDTGTPYAFMANMGIWFENFGLPVVINECLLQSYNGVIRLFPNWPVNQSAAFEQLRAVGAFLVSAEYHDGQVVRVKIMSEKGGNVKIYSPWPMGAALLLDEQPYRIQNSILVFKMKPDQQLVVRTR